MMRRSKKVWSSRGLSSTGESSLGKRRLIKTLKWIIYSLYLIFAYVIMVTPKLMEISAIKPLLILPLTVCIGVFEGELSGGIFAIFAGFVWGANDVALFTGYYSLILFFCAVICGLFIKYFFKTKLINVVFLSSLSLILYLLTSFYFKYGMRGYEGLTVLFVKNYIPTFIYTLLTTPFYFILIRWTHTAFRTSGTNLAEEV